MENNVQRGGGEEAEEEAQVAHQRWSTFSNNRTPPEWFIPPVPVTNNDYILLTFIYYLIIILFFSRLSAEMKIIFSSALSILVFALSRKPLVDPFNLVVVNVGFCSALLWKKGINQNQVFNNAVA